MKVLFALVGILAATAASTAAFAHEEERLVPLKELHLDSGQTIVVDKNDMTVYTFDNDTSSESTCYEDCASAWPPVLVSADQELGEAVGTTTRRDGSLQLTLNGKPVYFFAGDSKPGDINGDGLGGVWHIILD